MGAAMNSTATTTTTTTASSSSRSNLITTSTPRVLPPMLQKPNNNNAIVTLADQIVESTKLAKNARLPDKNNFKLLKAIETSSQKQAIASKSSNDQSPLEVQNNSSSKSFENTNTTIISAVSPEPEDDTVNIEDDSTSFNITSLLNSALKNQISPTSRAASFLTNGQNSQSLLNSNLLPNSNLGNLTGIGGNNLNINLNGNLANNLTTGLTNSQTNLNHSLR